MSTERPAHEYDGSLGLSTQVLGKTIVTVPWAAHTAVSPLEISMRATPLRFVKAMTSATPVQTPDETGLSRLSLNSVVATHAPRGMSG